MKPMQAAALDRRLMLAVALLASVLSVIGVQNLSSPPPQLPVQFASTVQH